MKADNKKKLVIAGVVGLGLAFMLNNSASAAAATGTSADGGGGEGDSPYLPTPTRPTPTKPRTPTTTGSTTGFPMKRGSTGAGVKKLQAWLGLKADGMFGPLTETALRKKTGQPGIATAADFNALLKGASATGQQAPVTIPNADGLATSLFQACFVARTIPKMGGDMRSPKVIGQSVVWSFRETPDYATINSILSGRSDNELRIIGGVFNAKYAKLSWPRFGAVLDHWNGTALKLYGLYAIRTRLGVLGL